MVTTETDTTTMTTMQAEAPTAPATAEGGRKPKAPREGKGTEKGSNAKAPPATSASGTASVATGITKGSMILNLLQRKKGASMDEMRGATSWQTHSVRGFLSAVVRKKLQPELISETGKRGIRRYRVDGDGAAAG